MPVGSFVTLTGGANGKILNIETKGPFDERNLQGRSMDGSVKTSLALTSSEKTGADDLFPSAGFPATPPPAPNLSANAASDDEERSPFEEITVPVTSRVKQVWAVGGGKGGVGKSLLASSLAITLSRLGNK